MSPIITKANTTHFRRGDGAETAMIELVDFNEVYNPNAGKVKTTKKTRRGGGAKKAAEAGIAAAVAAPAVAEAVEAEEEAGEEAVLESTRDTIIEDVTHQSGAGEIADETTEEEEKKED